MPNNNGTMLCSIYFGAVCSMGSGLWGWLGDNANQISSIGVIVGLIFGIVGIYFQYVRFINMVPAVVNKKK